MLCSNDRPDNPKEHSRWPVTLVLAFGLHLPMLIFRDTGTEFTPSRLSSPMQHFVNQPIILNAAGCSSTRTKLIVSECF